jgi:hypothetical protein
MPLFSEVRVAAYYIWLVREFGPVPDWPGDAISDWYKAEEQIGVPDDISVVTEPVEPGDGDKE